MKQRKNDLEVISWKEILIAMIAIKQVCPGFDIHIDTKPIKKKSIISPDMLIVYMHNFI